MRLYREATEADEGGEFRDVVPVEPDYEESESIRWCTEHKSSARDERSERCQAVLNMALREGLNPFDSYNNRRFGKCVIVDAALGIGGDDE